MKVPMVALLYCALLPALFAVEHPYEAATVVDIQQKVNTRVLYYQVNTPVTQDDPYYEVSLRLGEIDWVGQYTPRHASDMLPEDLVVNSSVQVRIEKRHMFLKRSNGGELDLVILRHTSAKVAAGEKQAAPSKD